MEAPRFLKSLLCQDLPSVSVGRAGRRMLSHSDKPIGPDIAKARGRAQPRPCGARPRGAAPVGDPERRATLRPRRLLLKCGPRLACVVRRGLSGQRLARAGEAGAAEQRGFQLPPHGPVHPGCRASPVLPSADPAGPTQGRPGVRSPCQRRSRPRCHTASIRSSPRWVLWGPPVLLAAQWNKTRRRGFAPARTTVWPPEQGTQALGPQFCRIYYSAPLGLGRSRTYHFGPRQLVGQRSPRGLATTQCLESSAPAYLGRRGPGGLAVVPAAGTRLREEARASPRACRTVLRPRGAAWGPVTARC